MSDEKKMYNHMENVFQYLNKKYVSLDEKLIRRNNKILSQIVDAIINKMKDKDVLFRSCYRTLFYGGSYYDGLKVGRPEEYDLDLLMTLPKYAEPVITLSTIPGFVRLQLTEMEKFMKQTEYVAKYSTISSILDGENHLCTNKVLSWMDSLVTKALREFPESGNQYLFEAEGTTFYAKVAKGGPAFTLKINGKIADEEVYMDIDLVPCFVFSDDKWPSGDYRRNPFNKEKPEFFIVPKCPKGTTTEENRDRCWRLSFQEQEKLLMNGKGVLKPALKLLKKLRDHLKHKCISSYFIKTVFLWEIETTEDKDFWKQTLSSMYISMLRRYSSYIEAKNIPYFWNKSFNLIGQVKGSTLDNVRNKLKAIENEIDRNVTDQYIGAKALLTEAEFEQLKKDVPVGRKQLKTQHSLTNSASLSDIRMPSSAAHVHLKTTATTSDCVDGSAETSANADLTKILSAINKLQRSTENLTLTVSTAQAEQVKFSEKIARYNENVISRVNNLEAKVAALRDENDLLKRKLDRGNASADVDDLLSFDALKPTADFLRSGDLLP